MNECLQNDERITIALRDIYQGYGYRQYKVGKFEEYDFYMQNKRFLLSEQVLTFSDTDGKLMALKPDITLSIIKNSKDDGQTRKLCYTEHVYRVPRGGYGFREIMQTGLECIGNIDVYAMCEVLMLAGRSLECISRDYVLDVSDMGIISGILCAEGANEETQSKIFAAFGEKNRSLLQNICRQAEISADAEELLMQLIGLYAPLDEALEALKKLPLPAGSLDAYESLKELCAGLSGYGKMNINLDFSVVNDMDYYNGIIFKGFIDGIPASVLSGGRYDSLAAKMGKRCGAIGFAVYLDELERFNEQKPEYDVDTLIVYDKGVASEKLIKTAEEFRKSGQSVRVQQDEDGVTYRRLLRLEGERVEQ